MRLKSLTSILALGLASACGVEGAQDPGAEPLGTTTAALTRGRDLLDVHAPLYQVTMAVQVLSTADPSIPVHKIIGQGGNPNLTTFKHVDQVRASMQGFVTNNGNLVLGSEPTTCIIGTAYDRGDLEPKHMIYTEEGGVYTTCMGNPDKPDMVGMPMQFARPIEVDPSESLDLYTRFEVLGSGTIWGPGSDPEAGVTGGLHGIGGFFEKSGTVLAMVPGLQVLGGAAMAVGSVMNKAGDVMQVPQHGPDAVCQISDNLIPGFGPDQPKTDSPSPLLRTQLSGRELFEQTRHGDALLSYDLDWGAMPGSHLCNRPHTIVQLRIRRVVGEGTAGAPLVARSGTLIGPYPDRLDAFSVDDQARIVHDQRLARRWSPSSEALQDQRYLVGRGFGLWVDLFPANARLEAVSKAPGQTDIYGVDTNGDIVGNWRAVGYDNEQWHTWNDVSTGALFPPGAPVKVLTRNPDHLDVFAVAKDGSVMTSAWDVCCGWMARPITIMPAGTVKPWNGTNGGGLGLVSQSNDTVTVFAANNNYHLVEAWWTARGGWTYSPDFGPPQPPAVWYQPGSEFAAVSRSVNRIDLFFVDAYGKVRTEWYDGSWRASSQQQITPDSFPAVRGGGIAVVARKVDVTGDSLVDNDNMDVFTVGQDGRILYIPWTFGENNFGWNPAAAKALVTTAQPGGPIGAISPNPGSIQVAARRADGSIAKTWYEEVRRGNLEWQVIP